MYCTQHKSFPEEMYSVTRVQILDKAACISLNTNAPGKGIIYLFFLQLWEEGRADYVFSLG